MLKHMAGMVHAGNLKSLFKSQPNAILERVYTSAHTMTILDWIVNYQTEVTC